MFKCNGEKNTTNSDENGCFSFISHSKQKVRFFPVIVFFIRLFLSAKIERRKIKVDTWEVKKRVKKGGKSESYHEYKKSQKENECEREE